MGYFTKREPGVYYVKTESSPHFHVSNFHKTWSPSNNVNNSYFPGYCICNFFSVILKAYSKSFKMFKMSFFTKIFTALSHKLSSQKAPFQMFDRVFSTSLDLLIYNTKRGYHYPAHQSQTRHTSTILSGRVQVYISEYIALKQNSLFNCSP